LNLHVLGSLILLVLILLSGIWSAVADDTYPRFPTDGEISRARDVFINENTFSHEPCDVSCKKDPYPQRACIDCDRLPETIKSEVLETEIIKFYYPIDVVSPNPLLLSYVALLYTIRSTIFSETPKTEYLISMLEYGTQSSDAKTHQQFYFSNRVFECHDIAQQDSTSRSERDAVVNAWFNLCGCQKGFPQESSDRNLKIDIETKEGPNSCNFLFKVTDKNSGEPIPGAALKITITDQQTGTSKRTLEMTTDEKGEYRWTENWEPNDLGKTYLAEVSATKDGYSPDDTSTSVTVPLTAIVGDVLEIVLYKPPMTGGYVWICPAEIDDVSNLNECWPPSAPFWTTWDEDGKFNLLDYRNYHQTDDYPILQKGRYRVWAWASGYLPTNVLVDVKEGKTAQAALRPATSLRHLDFHLVDVNNAPIKNAEVSLNLPGAGAAGKISSKTNDQGMTWLQLQGTLSPCKLTTYDLEVIDPNTGATIATGTLDTSIPYCSGPLDFGKTNNLTGALSWDTIKAKNNSSIIKIKVNYQEQKTPAKVSYLKIFPINPPTYRTEAQVYTNGNTYMEDARRFMITVVGEGGYKVPDGTRVDFSLTDWLGDQGDAYILPSSAVTKNSEVTVTYHPPSYNYWTPSGKHDPSVDIWKRFMVIKATCEGKEAAYILYMVRPSAID
jgi:hypothetical protein